MLLRKRAWDIMREEYAVVRTESSLTEAIAALSAIQKKQPDMTFALVFTENDRFAGLLSMWSLIQSMGPCMLKGSDLISPQVNWDDAFEQACRNCAQVKVKDCLQPDVPIVKPNDLLARVLEVFLDYRRGRAVVEEGGRIIGVITLADVFKEIQECIIP
ncbi:MAG: CBS domain-containing protein [Desulfomicrobium sp.]|jgi:CBS domain-containing protein|nr:CBS domain-containing protein [Desulfomicrobium sp.]NLV96287.1 CBS domain-containing protein [Desulfovibrionales bacterium]